MSENQKWRSYWLYHFPWQFLMVTIFVLSSIGQEDMPEIVEKFSDKFLHFGVFGLLGVLMVRGFRVSRIAWLKTYAAGWTVIFCSLYGILDELHQLLVPGRQCSMTDWLADTGGSLMLILLFSWYSRKKSATAKISLQEEKTGPAPAGDRKSG